MAAKTIMKRIAIAALSAVILRFEPAHINRKTNIIIPGLEKQEITARQMKNI